MRRIRRKKTRHIRVRHCEAISPRGMVEIELTHIRTGRKIRKIFHNVVVNCGKELITKRLTGSGNDCEITYGAVGTGSTAASASDTALETELKRKLLSTRTYTETTIVMLLYLGTTEGNGVLTEIGLYGDGASGTPDSGVLFNRAIISVTKTSSYTMTAQLTITLI